ncbi:MAG: hypothetical protein OIN85_01155 [Candidatus Methanoperedens sp.]|nr:hypothetical protein [Candidatus Methanoperedens sp.]
MATPPSRAQANTDTNTDLTALTNAANAAFIDAAGDAIDNAVAQGLFRVNLTTLLHCDLQYLSDYFRGLGYDVNFPTDTFVQPAQLFGPFFEEFFLTPNTRGLTNPAEMIISWSN